MYKSNEYKSCLPITSVQLKFKLTIIQTTEMKKKGGKSHTQCEPIKYTDRYIY